MVGVYTGGHDQGKSWRRSGPFPAIMSTPPCHNERPTVNEHFVLCLIENKSGFCSLFAGALELSRKAGNCVGIYCTIAPTV